MKINKPLAVALIGFLLFVVYVNVSKADTDYTTRILSEGSDAKLYFSAISALEFQSDITNKSFIIETIAGNWNASDVSFGHTNRGGNLYFYENETAYVQFYNTNPKEPLGLTITANGIATTKIKTAIHEGYEWNGTFLAGQDYYLTWGWPITLPYEPDFMLWIGLVGIALIFIGLMLMAYAFRHYKIFTLGDEELVWEKDVLAIAIACLIFGIGLIFAWLYA